MQCIVALRFWIFETVLFLSMEERGTIENKQKRAAESEE